MFQYMYHRQVVEEDVQHVLEEIEKETDIDDILNYRSVAEQELEVLMLLLSLESSYHISCESSYQFPNFRLIWLVVCSIVIDIVRRIIRYDTVRQLSDTWPSVSVRIAPIQRCIAI